MGSKQELILNHIIDMKETIGGVLKHLETLNNRIEKGDKKIDENKIYRFKVDNNKALNISDQLPKLTCPKNSKL